MGWRCDAVAVCERCVGRRALENIHRYSTFFEKGRKKRVDLEKHSFTGAESAISYRGKWLAWIAKGFSGKYGNGSYYKDSSNGEICKFLLARTRL